jgi:hypothetical protein
MHSQTALVLAQDLGEPTGHSELSRSPLSLTFSSVAEFSSGHRAGSHHYFLW